MRYALRCDYCGVFHKITIKDGVPILENFSGIVYPLANEEQSEDVQQLNNSNNERSDLGDAEEPVSGNGAAGGEHS